MDMLKRLRGQAEQVEVVRVHNESTTVSFDANVLKSSQVEETRGVAVRVVKDGRLGFAASSDESASERLVTNALESAAHGEAIPIRFPPPQPAPGVAAYDPAVASLTIPRFVEIGREMIDYLLQVEPEARISVQLRRSVQRLSVRNQAGADIAFEQTPLSLVVEASLVRGDDILLVYELAGTTAWDDDYLALARDLGEKLILARRMASLKSGRMPVLFAPAGVQVLALPLLQGLTGDNVYKRVSPLAGKVGEKLFDAKLTIADDATLDGRYASAPYDDEGVPHRRNVLVERGVLKGFMYDLKTAARSGVESTGNGSRSLFSQPSPAPTNWIIEPGETPLAEMIRGIDEGLLVEDALGLGQGNVLSGAFSNPLNLAYKIEKGDIVGRVKDVSLAGNIYELLPRVAAISREAKWIFNLRLPYILLPEVKVVGTE